MLVRTDCRHYSPTEPCRPHKQARIRCPRCGTYDAVAERILIVKLGAMGDVLRTTSCLTPLKQRYPRSHVTWITRPNAVPLLEGNPGIDRVLSVNSNYLELLLAERFDLAIGPETDTLSASIVALARSDVKQGFTADGRGGVTPLSDAAEGWWRMGVDDGLKQANRRTYGEWLYAMCDLPMPVARPSFQLPPGSVEQAAQRLQDRAPGVKRWICFNTGASGRWEEKRWKPAYYERLARLIESNDPDAAIVLAGGPDEAALNRQLRLAHSGFIDGGTDNSVADFAALVAVCDWILTCDSLGYHVACAVGTPALCLVGPTSPWELDLFAENCVVSPPLDCIACYLPKCPLSRTCMDALTPELIWDRVSEWRSWSQPPRLDIQAPRFERSASGVHPLQFFRATLRGSGLKVSRAH
jgi:ADP-heptose:LPS heptosyltransferase